MGPDLLASTGWEGKEKEKKGYDGRLAVLAGPQGETLLVRDGVDIKEGDRRRRQRREQRERGKGKKEKGKKSVFSDSC